MYLGNTLDGEEDIDQLESVIEQYDVRGPWYTKKTTMTADMTSEELDVQEVKHL